jgi:hypothetical protein
MAEYPTFQLLRQVAECASGLRNDQNLCFVLKGDGTFTTETLQPGQPLPPPTPDAVYIPVTAVNDPPSRIGSATITGKGGAAVPVDLLSVTVPPIGAYPGGTFAADAAFWSVSAVEKFLLPYYASVYGDQAPEIVKDVLSVLMDSEVVTDPAVQPFALIHLPSSEYAEVLTNGGIDFPKGADGADKTRARREYFDDMFILYGQGATPLTRQWRQQIASPSGRGASADGTGAVLGDTTASTVDRGSVSAVDASPDDSGAEPPHADGAHSGGEMPRRNGSRSKYSRMAGR